MSDNNVTYKIVYSHFCDQFRTNDVIVMTFPKCGTTWTQEILWTMLNNPDLEDSKGDISINERCCFFECDALTEIPTIPKSVIEKEILPNFRKMCPGKDPENGIFLPMTNSSPDPRIIKTHLPLSLLCPNILNTCKIIYVARNPKDLCLSYLHHSKIITCHKYTGDLEQYIGFFVNDKTLYSPYGQHVSEAWQQRNNGNLHFMFYEDMQDDINKVINDLDDFLGTKLTPKQKKNVIHQSSFSVMKSKNNAMMGDNLFIVKDAVEKEGGFYRKGMAGDFKNSLSSEHEQKIEAWIKRTCPEVSFRY